MKFFKHFTDAHSSTSMNQIIQKLGLEGYAQFFILLELCVAKWATKEDGSEHCEFRFDRSYLARIVRTKYSHLGKILSIFEQCGQMKVLRCDNEVIISVPKILKSLDRDYKYNRKRVVSVSQNTRLELEREEEREKEEYIVKPIPTLAASKIKTKEGIREMIPILSYEKWYSRYDRGFVDAQVLVAIEYYMAEPGHEFWQSLAWVRKINAWLARGHKMSDGRSEVNWDKVLGEDKC